MAQSTDSVQFVTIAKNNTLVYIYVCVHIKRYHVVDHRKGDIGQNSKKSKKVKNDFLTET